jgi:Fic family protein
MGDAIDLEIEVILSLFSDGRIHTRRQIEHAVRESPHTINRALNELLARGWIAQQGSANAIMYTLTLLGRTRVVFNLAAYLRRPPAEHAAFTHIQPTLFELVEGSMPKAVLEQCGIARHANSDVRSHTDPVTAHKDIQRFVIELSWKLSVIEGNTYTLHDTERLLINGIPASGRLPTETAMILNHKRAFDYIWHNAHDYQDLTRRKLFEVHRLLMADLKVSTLLRTNVVDMAGTTYIPPAGLVEVRSYLDDILDRINHLKEPAEKAMACLILLPYLQPFLAGNKRISWMIANAVLLANNYPPISLFTIREETYNGALLLFYEQGASGNVRKLVLEQLAYSSTHYSF